VYVGLGFYGTVTGKRGGLFTLGANFGIKKSLSKHLFLDASFHFGGGGGAGAPDGGGAMILPQINLGYQFKGFSTTLGYSYINFFDKGNINSKQLTIGIQIPVSYDFADFNEKEKNFKVEQLKTTEWNQPAKDISLLFHLNNLSLTGNTKDTNGNSLTGNTVRLAGFEVNSYLNQNWLVFFRADGAYDGIDAGYMDILFGGGYHFSFNKNNTNILAKFGIGAGGGGGVDTQGGFLIYPDISIEQKVFKDLYLSINKGYLLTPNSHFKASTFGVGVKYYVHQQGIISKNKKSFATAKLKGIQFGLSQEVYFEAKRNTNPTENLQLISLQGNLFLNNYLYVAGQTSFANFRNAGAYAEGIVGFGVYSNSVFNKKVTLFAQFLAGAAGGGNISTGQGLIIKPSVGLDYHISRQISLKTTIGKVKAKGGLLNSTSFSVGLNYNISILKAH